MVSWIEKGTALLTQCNVAGRTTHALVELIGNGQIDAQEVQRLLALQGWEHTSTSDYDYGEKENVEYFPLVDSWQIAVGCATVLGKGQFQSCPASASWLNQGLGFFETDTEFDGENESIPLVDAAHLAWLQELCRTHAWARQTVAQWLLDEPSHSPAWEWVFNEELGLNPSAEFLDSILQTLDERAQSASKHHWEHAVREERMALLERQAPLFFQQVQELHGMHLGLYGGIPDEWDAAKNYHKERALLVAGALSQHYAGNAESLDASTSPSMGKLFCEDTPSMAVW